MKQLLIVNKTSAYAAEATGADFSTLANGAIMFFSLEDYSKLTTLPESNFGIALGRGNNSPAFVIPEVDVNTLSIVKAAYQEGKKYSAEITIPTTEVGNTYTVVLIKNDGTPHKRNTWTATESLPFDDDAPQYNKEQIAELIFNKFKAMVDSGSLDISVALDGAKIIFTANNFNDFWTVKCADDLSNVVPVVTEPEARMGDKAYVQHLASMCAAGKGFTETVLKGDGVYPGYPEPVEADAYDVYTLRFKVGRDAAKTRDERVWQVVHIAVPTDATSKDAIATIMGYGTVPASVEEPTVEPTEE